MKEIKFILLLLLCAIYTSSWWVAAMWGYGWSHDDPSDRLGMLWFIPGIFTICVLFMSVFYILDVECRLLS